MMRLKRKEQKKTKNRKGKMMIMRAKLKERYTKVKSEIVDLIDEIISQVKEKNNKEDDNDDDVNLQKINCILKIHCEIALKSLKKRLDNKRYVDIKDEYMYNKKNKYYMSWRIFNEVLRNKYNDEIKSSVDRVFELVLHVIGEREFGKERMMEMEKELGRYKEAMGKFVYFVETAIHGGEDIEEVKEKMMEICAEALDLLFEEIAEGGASDEFEVVDDELMVYKDVINEIYGRLGAKEDQEEVEILLDLFDSVYYIIMFYAEEEEEKIKSGWLHGFFKTLAVFGKKVAGRWWR